MNILTEAQVAARGLSLPAGGMLTDVPGEFIAELQIHGTFVEYNQQVIAPAGQLVDYVICVISGHALLSRRDDHYTKAKMGSLAAGQWFGEMSLFVDTPAREELFAEGEVIVWTVAPDTLRDLFFRSAGSTQLLYNLATVLAQKLAVKGDGNVAVSTAA